MSDTQAQPPDIIVIGGGPVGLAAAIEAQRAGLSVRIYERGTLAHTIFRFPVGMTFFSDAPNIEIGGHPLVCNGTKPTRREALSYYQKVARAERLDVRTYHAVTRIEPLGAGFRVHGRDESASHSGESFTDDCRYVIVATGYFDRPTFLGVPGEELPFVTNRYTESAPYWGRSVGIVGGSNSAVETALDLYRSGANVTLIHRGADVRKSVKYWLRPDFENRVREGAITAIFGATVREFRPGFIVADIRESSGEIQAREIAVDFAIVFVGFRAVDDLLRELGVEFAGDKPVLSAHFETTQRGAFVIGSAGFGADTRSVFIENGRDHALAAVAEIVRRMCHEPEMR